MSALHAEPWRVALVGSEEPFSQMVSRQAHRHLEHTNETANAFLREEQARKEDWALWNEWKDSYDKGILPSWSLKEPLKARTFDGSVELVDVADQDGLSDLLLASSADWFCDAYGYDEVWISRSVPLSGGTRCTLDRYVRESDTRSRLLDALSLEETIQDLLEETTLALLAPHTTTPLAALSVSEAPPSLRIQVDGEPVDRDGNLVITASGSHKVRLFAPGCETKEIPIQAEEGTVVSIDASLKPLVLGTFQAVSEVGEGSWFVDGKEAGETSSISLDDISLPMVVTFQKESYLTLTHQITKETDLVAFRPDPLWARNPQLVEDAQKDFYRAFLMLVCSVGLTLAYPTIYNVEGNDNYVTGGLYVAFQGAAAMSAVSLVGSLAAYSQAILRR